MKLKPREQILKEIDKEVKKVEKTSKQLESLISSPSPVTKLALKGGLKKLKEWQITRQKRKITSELSKGHVNYALEAEDREEIKRRLRALGEFL